MQVKSFVQLMCWPTDGHQGGQVLHHHLHPINVTQAPPPSSAGSGLDFEVEDHAHYGDTKGGGYEQGKRDAWTIFSMPATAFSSNGVTIPAFFSMMVSKGPREIALQLFW